MAEPASDRSKQIAAAANRLRMIQIDFADRPVDERTAYLSEELSRAMENVIPQDREAFLQELMARFPTWDPNVEARPIEQQPAVRSETDQRELQDPSFLVTRLADLAPGLSQQQRQAVIERLRQAGLTPKVTHGLPEQAVEALRSKMGLPKDADVDATRLVQLLGELAYFASTLDQVVWSTWHHLAARSTIRRRAPVRASAGRFVAGDEDTSRSQVADGLELLRQITASLVSAVSKCGELFGGPHLARFSPDAIERLVRIEGTSWIKAKEVQYWEKYRQLFAELSVASIQKEIEDVISKYVEDVMKGLGRRTS